LKGKKSQPFPEADPYPNYHGQNRVDGRGGGKGKRGGGRVGHFEESDCGRAMGGGGTNAQTSMNPLRISKKPKGREKLTGQHESEFLDQVVQPQPIASGSERFGVAKCGGRKGRKLGHCPPGEKN